LAVLQTFQLEVWPGFALQHCRDTKNASIIAQVRCPWLFLTFHGNKHGTMNEFRLYVILNTIKKARTFQENDKQSFFFFAFYKIFVNETA
jgi:hypothetical protein